MSKTGIIYGVNGPVIYLKGDTGFKISEMVYVGPEKLVGHRRFFSSRPSILKQPARFMYFTYIKK